MLRYLSIKNLAVIESLELTFQPGLSVLTGETGAGKSIVVGAVGLLLGDRASPDMIRTGEETAIVQAVFEVDGNELLVRRELLSSGRSRGFINDALVTAASLKDLGATLVDLHGQHEHQTLLQPEHHLALLDQFASVSGELGEVEGAYQRWSVLRDEMATLRKAEQDKEERVAYLRFQLQDINKIDPKPGEDDDLAGQRHLLANAERLRRLAEEAYDRLYEGEGAATETLGGVWRKLDDLAALDARFEPYVEGRTAVTAYLDDLAAFLREYAAHVEAAPERLQDIEDRLAALERLKRRFGGTLAEVDAKRIAFRHAIEAIEGSTARLADLEADVAVAAAQYLAAARRLSAKRRDAATLFARALEQQLAELAMERTRFDVRFAPLDEAETRWTAAGIDVAEFYVSPNPGEELRPLARIVSGGELSRIMLALKTIASTDSPGKTLVFDEVDAGIGGRVADVVGQRLQALGQRFQVLCITHLPQIAAYGQDHFHVAKSVRKNRTVTTVDVLSADARVDELARMMAGSVLTDATRATAREMLSVRAAAIPKPEAGRKAKAKVPAKGESESH